MPDNPTPKPASKEAETHKPFRSWVVIHLNPSGHHFATRVEGKDAEGAAAVIESAHADNRTVHVYPDKGEKSVEYDGADLAVHELEEEP